ncbi:DUF7660 family protein [Nocardia alni]|uniref:DUF7660 family protein n=1 Tax=Nocardia alni TaxID=2815723 RepID=UPI001C23D9D3|nr:hypothetical protein [Nocardia alni]
MAERDPASLRTRSEFVEYVRALAEAVGDNPGQYENISSAELLEAAAAWVDDADACAAEADGQSRSVDWSFIAKLLTAALIYE